MISHDTFKKWEIFVKNVICAVIIMSYIVYVHFIRYFNEV